MNILTPERNYIPIDFHTRLQACKRRVISKRPIRKILSFYHVKRSSLYRRLGRCDGTDESLLDQSHRPKNDHPNKLKGDIVKKVLVLHRRNPNHLWRNGYVLNTMEKKFLHQVF